MKIVRISFSQTFKGVDEPIFDNERISVDDGDTEYPCIGYQLYEITELASTS